VGGAEPRPDSIPARRFDASGVPLGADFQVNVYTSFNQTAPAIAPDPDGGFVVTWASDGQDGDGSAVIARRYDGTGSPQGDEFRVNTYTPSWQVFPAVASVGAGEFVTVWESFPLF